YPLYDYAHCLEDAFEDITHSICTIEFENNRELYDWILDAAGFAEPRNHQYEFARLNLDYTVMSKRQLIRLVQEGHVRGWDDPRMPTLAGLRRRGVPPEAIRRFVGMDGVTKVNSSLDPSKLDFAVRDVLNPVAPRAMAVLRPLRIVLTDWPDGHVTSLQAPFYPDDDTSPTRPVPMSKGLWIDEDDFALEPPPGWKRLAPGREVRLRHGYVIKCHAVIENPDGGPMTLHCTHDPSTLGRSPGRKIGGTLHWVAATGAVPAEFRLYDRLFSVPDPNDVPEDGDFTDHLNPDSLTTLNGWVEPSLVEGVPGVPVLTAPAPESRVQFERLGYFARDADSTRRKPVFNRIVPLRDTWKKRAAEGGAPKGHTAAEGRPRSDEDRAPAPVPVYQTDQDRIAGERTAAREVDPELGRRFVAYQDERGLSTKQADLLTADRAVSDFFEAAAAAAESDSDAAAWIVNDLQGLLPGGGVAGLPVDGSTVGRLVRLVLDGGVSRRAAKDVLAELVRDGGDPEAIIERDGLAPLDDEAALRAAVQAVLAEWPDKVVAYRAGRTNLIGLFMGQVMKATEGRADPQAVRTLLVELLRGEAS
ncbi:MAG: glutamine--tRNA ligase, partial [Gemmatimonadetes bacterium]|nr:glutamine--tRNA ligase [Gemmatimonadota bacterium]